MTIRLYGEQTIERGKVLYGHLTQAVDVCRDLQDFLDGTPPGDELYRVLVHIRHCREIM